MYSLKPYLLLFIFISNNSFSQSEEELVSYLGAHMRIEYSGWFAPKPFTSREEVREEFDSIMKAAAGCGNARQHYIATGRDSSNGVSYCRRVEKFKSTFFPRLFLTEKKYFLDQEFISRISRFYAYDMMD